MPTEVIMPALGMAQEKGTLVSWLKAEGEPVIKGEPLMEVETDKATVEIEAPASGILADIAASPGDQVPVGQKIAVIVTADESRSNKNTIVATGVERSTPPSAPQVKAPPAPKTQQAPIPGRTPASPAARRVAKQKGIDLAALKGSGPEGSVLVRDVAGAGRAADPVMGGPPKVKETIPLTAMRRVVGRRMSESKRSAPHFYLGMDVDMTALEKERAEGKNRKEEPLPSINDFILWACASALTDFPYLNSAYSENGIQIFDDINIGTAVAIEEGLVVPVIRNADLLTLRELAQKSRALAEKAQRKKLMPLDYEGGTFTVSNLGALGVDQFVAIINPPQAAILAVGRVAPRVVSLDGKIVVRPMMTMTLSADHRVVDGAVATRFLQRVKAMLENLG